MVKRMLLRPTKTLSVNINFLFPSLLKYTRWMIYLHDTWLYYWLPASEFDYKASLRYLWQTLTGPLTWHWLLCLITGHLKPISLCFWYQLQDLKYNEFNTIVEPSKTMNWIETEWVYFETWTIMTACFLFLK